MRRVLLVSPSAKAGGAERAFLGLTRALPSSSWEPCPVLLEDGPLAEWLTDAGHVPVVLDAHRTRELHHTTVTIARLARLARGTDAVVSSMSKGHVYGGTAAALARVPSVWWQHGVPRRSRIEFAAGRVPAAAVVCVSDAAARAQRELTPWRAVTRLYPGIAVSDVSAAAGTGVRVRSALGWERATVIGVLGRLQRGKGHEDVLRAFAELVPRRPEVRLAIVGGAILGWEGAYPEELRALASELGLADRVHFAGHQSHPWEWLDAFDVAVHASTGDSFGLVLVEAMALGKPVVTTATGGSAEVVEDGRSGLLVQPHDAHGLATAIASVLDDPALAARLADGGRERAERFTEAIAGAEFAGLLDGLERVGVPARAGAA
jgi:glycosyltransferase involved in cell wall biosynthesis